MSWALERFRHHASSGGFRNGVARATSRALGLAADRMRSASDKIVDPIRGYERLPADLVGALSHNSRFNGRYAGQRVLLVGSGPSAARLDKVKVDGRSVIAVNEMFAPVQAAGLKLAAVVIHDPLYFNGSADMDRMLADAANAASADGALMAVPAQAVATLVAKGIVDPLATIAMFESGRNVATLARPAQIVDLARAVPSLQTVSHAALVVGLYLGFEEIAMLGVDLTFVGAPSRPIRHGYGQNPYYDAINHATAASAFLSGHGWDWPYVLRDVATQLEAYDWLASGGALQGRRVVNLAAESLLSTVGSIHQEHLT
jgi:hypothetical protein